jgi:serine/threonine protein kinase
MYLARRADHEFDRLVAIKMIRRGMDSELVVRRFRHERQILASLEHPHIAALFDGGTTPEGLPSSSRTERSWRKSIARPVNPVSRKKQRWKRRPPHGTRDSSFASSESAPCQ